VRAKQARIVKVRFPGLTDGNFLASHLKSIASVYKGRKYVSMKIIRELALLANTRIK
jgi:hypothetical protein